MDFRFEFLLEPKWPALAWIAQCSPGDPVIRLRHGPQVEVKPNWFCEAIWDGEFDYGDFDRTDLVFGSGGRLRDGRVVFVSAASTVDRLHLFRRSGEVMVSNSLACLLAISNVDADPTFEGWMDFFLSVKDGIDAYNRRLPTIGEVDVELVYFRNVAWNGDALFEEDKAAPERDFGSFEKYYGFLNASVRRIAANAAATSRQHRYEMIGTLSSGYDAATAATVCRESGMRSVISAQRARGSGRPDDGKEIADALGLELLLFERTGWRCKDYPEAPFFAANPRGGEVFLSAAGDFLRGKVLITGFHGDKVWGKHTKALGSDVVRGDMSGLSLCEYRLHLGCVHFPLAFLGVRQVRDINRLSNAPEMAPWDIPGDYSRPICRRILEQAGVPREVFGMRKQMASVHFGQGESLLTDHTRIAYHRWLRTRQSTFNRDGTRRVKVPGPLVLALRERYYLVSRAAKMLAWPLPTRVKRWVERRVAALQWELNQRINIPEYVFPWAIERMQTFYSPSR